MGYSVRDADWRYTEWRKWNQTTLHAIWVDQSGVAIGPLQSELYDHRDEVLRWLSNARAVDCDSVFISV